MQSETTETVRAIGLPVAFNLFSCIPKMTDMADIEGRLKKLKKLKVEVQLRNKKEVYKEEAKKEQRRVYSMSEDDRDKNHKGSEERADKLLKYSIRDYENWAKITKEKEQNRSNTGDFQALAKASYRKDIRTISSNESRTLSGTITDEGKVIVEDDPALLNKLAKSLDEQAKKRYTVRKNKVGKHENPLINKGYINDKNRRFNKKLENQFK